MASEKLFTYGLLMKGQRYHESHMAGLYKGVLPAAAYGRLMYLPEADAPAFTADDTEERQVKGEVYDVDETIFKSLDYLFGYDPNKPQKSEYVRRKIEVQIGEDEFVEAWAYAIRASTLRNRFPKATWIEQGDWQSYYEALLEKRAYEERKKYPGT